VVGIGTPRRFTCRSNFARDTQSLWGCARATVVSVCAAFVWMARFIRRVRSRYMFSGKGRARTNDGPRRRRVLLVTSSYSPRSSLTCTGFGTLPGSCRRWLGCGDSGTGRGLSRNWNIMSLIQTISSTMTSPSTWSAQRLWIFELGKCVPLAGGRDTLRKQGDRLLADKKFRPYLHFDGQFYLFCLGRGCLADMGFRTCSIS